MQYAEALKQVQSKKIKENFILVEIAYDKKLILPYKEGLAFIGSLANAEQLHDPYSKPKQITGLARDSIKTDILSYEEYERIKIAALLGVTTEEVKQYALEAS